MTVGLGTVRRSLLEHFSAIEDGRDPAKVMFPFDEVLLLVVCGTIAACDDYDEIVQWGEEHLPFLRRFLPYGFELPCADWLRILVNRIDPALFSACFMAFVAERLPGAVDQIALDGKTSRRSHDRGRGHKALHLVSAYATTARLVLGQRAVADKSNEITAIPILLAELADSGALAGSLVTIDAMGCQSAITEAIVEAGADYLLATKDNQKTAHAEIALYFADAPPGEIDEHGWIDKGHGRVEARRCRVSHQVGFMTGKRRYPGEARFSGLACIGIVENTVESGGERRVEQRCFISSRRLSAADFATAVRNHWAIENSLHWVLDVQFKEDQSRLRRGHGAQNMATIRHFALNLLRLAPGKLPIKRRRKLATWNTDYLEAILEEPRTARQA